MVTMFNKRALSLAVDKVLMSYPKNNLWRELYTLYNITKWFEMKTSPPEYKVM